MNKVSVKPYKEIEEKGDEEDDETAAKRFWDLHLLRNDSVVVDLFHGQYRSTITCPECHKVSITYDPYTTVPLPIPRLKKVDVYFIPQFNIRKTVKLSIFISEDASFFDIAHYINSNLDDNIGKFRCMIVSDNECLKMVKASDNIIKATEKGFIFCCEVDPKLIQSDYTNFVVHIRDGVKCEYKSYPRMFTVTQKMTLKDLKVIIYGFMRRFLELPQRVNDVLKNRYENLLETYAKSFVLSYSEVEEIIKEEYELIFGNGEEYMKLNDELKNEILGFRRKIPFVLYLNKDGSRINLFECEVDMSNIESQLLEELKLEENNSNILRCFIVYI